MGWIKKNCLAAVFACLMLVGCVAGQDPRLYADAIATDAGMQKILVPVPSFTLTGYQRAAGAGAPLYVYLEGDGRAYLNRFMVSPDPTPHRPIGLQLAAEHAKMDAQADILYLARPCQYTQPERNCDQSLWTTARFSRQMLSAIKEAIQKMNKANKPIHFVGFSGGAAVALLLADQGMNVASIRTVAGNIGHEAINRYHKVPQLKQSLPMQGLLSRLKQIPQRHFIGTKDPVVVPYVSHQLLRPVEGGCVAMVDVPGNTHLDGWKAIWPQLIRQPVSCGAPTPISQ